MRCLIRLAWLLVALAGGPAWAGNPIAIAAAADLRGALEEVRGAFLAGHPGTEVQLSFGASGSLTAQILQGAPFALFLSADTGFPEALAKAGKGTPDGPFPYAVGSLVLWLRADLNLNPAQGLAILRDPAVRRIAVANPATAPYGRAAVAALTQAGLRAPLEARLVYAENVAQAAQFLQTGSAEAGLVSASQARHPALSATGRAWVVPAGTYPPLRQAGLLLVSDPTARAFRDFLLGPEGQGILARHGFGRP